MANAFGIENQLKEAAQISGADWAALAIRSNGTWQITSAYHLNKTAQAELIKVMSTPSMDLWLCGGLSGGHSRSSAMPPNGKLKTKRMYAFPLQGTSRMIVAGADNLQAGSQKVWKLLVSLLTHNSNTTAQPFLPDLQSGIAFDLPLALEKVLSVIVDFSKPIGAWLAIRRGEELDVLAEWGASNAKGISLTIDANPLLRRVNRSLMDISISHGHPTWDDLPAGPINPVGQIWSCIPLVIGKRMIGVVSFWRKKALAPIEQTQLRDLAVRVAPSVEAVVTFSQMAGHLRRLALLNDFVLTISSAQNLDQITKRMFGLLSRAFNTELITFYLRSFENKTLNEYRFLDGRMSVVGISKPGSLVDRLIADDVRVQVVDDYSLSNFKPIHQDGRSMLAVPLKYRGKAIGGLVLESTKTGAFGQYDEHLMVVIASHLAGLLEYSRLREEAEGKARNLGLLHEVVQQVIGLTDKTQIADVTANFVASYFKYDLTGIFLKDDLGRFTIQGLGGKFADELGQFLSATDLQAIGIIDKAISQGSGVMLNDTDSDPAYRSLGAWKAGSGVYVPIRDETGCIGIILLESKFRNAFSSSDMIAMEALAGILTAVLSSASQYQRLQLTVHQLREAEIELKSRINAQKAAEAKLVQAAKLAAVGEMSASIAHELNNPLTTVTGFAEIVLADLSEGSSQYKDLSLVLQEARRASSVVRRLLDFSRRGDHVRAGADPNGIVEDVLALTRHLIDTNAVELILDLSAGLPWILVDDNQIKQVLLNLIHNALHAMPNGGKMWICTKLDSRDAKEWVVMSVRDTGMGIAEKQKERIFEPFYTTKGDQGGTGLGLSVTYNIIAEHGGVIEVISREKQGSTFEVWLPVIETTESNLIGN